MEKGSSTGLYILVAIVIFGIFIAMITGLLGQGVQEQVQGAVTFVEDFLSGESNGGDDDVIIDEDEDEEETPETPSNGYKGSKHKLNLTDEEIEAIVARIGFAPSKDIARAMLRNELTYDQLQDIRSGVATEPGNPQYRDGANHLSNWLINEPFWYPQGVGETVQSTEPIISYANNISDIVKNQRKPAAAQQELTDFYNYSMSYPEGSYERQYFDRTVRQIGHGHGIQVSSDGKITGNWPSSE